jgi:hypothetical protein
VGKAKKIFISDVSERPEPTPVPLLAIGLLSLGYFHRRRALQCGIVANLEEILSDLYESEINVSISWLWDARASRRLKGRGEKDRGQEIRSMA